MLKLFDLDYRSGVLMVDGNTWGIQGVERDLTRTSGTKDPTRTPTRTLSLTLTHYN